MKRYLAGGGKQVPGDIWTDIMPIGSIAKERTRYPTQQPLALLDRIILATAAKGGWVLDPFCGCAATLILAQGKHRTWVGIDISDMAVRLIDKRLRKEPNLFDIDRITRTDIPLRTGDDPGPYNTGENKTALYGRQLGYCFLCFMKPEVNLHIDPVVPVADGGTDHLENLQLLRPDCNHLKGRKSMAETIVKQKEPDPNWGKKKAEAMNAIQRALGDGTSRGTDRKR